MGSKPQLLQKVISLCRKRGFFFQAHEVPLSRNGKEEKRYAIGPLGAELKRNLINEWWYSVITSNDNVYAFSTPSFTKNMEKNISPQVKNNSYESNGDNQPDHDLWKGALTYLPDFVKHMGLKLPFGLAEIGIECRRNYSSKYFILKSPEYDSFGLQFFSSPEEHRKWYSHWQKKSLQWWKKFARHPEKFSLGDGEGKDPWQGEVAINNGDHYMQSTIQFEFPWGAHSLETITKCGGESFFQEVSQQIADVNCDSKNSSFKIARIRGKKAFPCLISLSGDIDGAMLAYLCDAYSETESTMELRAAPVLRLHRSLAPYKVAILPQDSTNEKLCKHETLKKLGMGLGLGMMQVVLLTPRRHNEMGTPYRVIVDEKLLDSGVVRLQDRDTTIQEEINGNDVLPTMIKFLSRELS